MLQRLDRHRQELRQHFERLQVGAAVIEHAKHSRGGQPAGAARLEECRNAIELMMRHDLRQVEVGAEFRMEQELDLPDRIGAGLARLA
ncbi:hypothetical protein D3C83_93200 [compost metagenome]